MGIEERIQASIRQGWFWNSLASESVLDIINHASDN